MNVTVTDCNPYSHVKAEKVSVHNHQDALSLVLLLNWCNINEPQAEKMNLRLCVTMNIFFH